ncbi:hypothetical protein BC828DRAFT_276827 [Blastocladiella britannica]|nr:hypothetical protein BC828DRAFT_276827 [Blastocladiella britannica]
MNQKKKKKKVFSTTSLASWYTRPIWLTCITMTYLIAMFASLAVASTYWLADFSKPIPFSGVRKGAIVASSGLTLVADMTVTVLILRIVLTIRRALDREDLAIQEWRERGSGFESPQPRLPTDTAERQKRKRQYRKVLTRVGTALLVMVVMALVGLANYLMSNHVSGTIHPSTELHFKN